MRYKVLNRALYGKAAKPVGEERLHDAVDAIAVARTDLLRHEGADGALQTYFGMLPGVACHP